MVGGASDLVEEAKRRPAALLCSRKSKEGRTKVLDKRGGGSCQSCSVPHGSFERHNTRAHVKSTRHDATLVVTCSTLSERGRHVLAMNRNLGSA